MIRAKRVIGERVLVSLMTFAARAPKGCFVEVGVYQGGSAVHLYAEAANRGVDLYLFDTFAGMPHRGGNDVHKVGDFAETTVDNVRALMPEAKIFPGIFPQTMPADLPGVALAHIDCDQEQSVEACILGLWPKMVRGGVMIFDDAPALKGATLAVDRHFPRRKISDANKYYVVK